MAYLDHQPVPGVAVRCDADRSTRANTENHPDITFASTTVDRVDGRWVLPGSLTVLGRTREVEVPVDDVRLDERAPRRGWTATSSASP
ncbi:YceI family protein [Amycolatopsis cihanbeyliensis]|uniref:YceI family protein n=1 Tax=Amycolatopsis cihanbeyliensis TaxID=1128664 RepID=UPI00114F8DE4|nr:YceI family protein [Amycolatopsis cihanbeyliensis]